MSDAFNDSNLYEQTSRTILDKSGNIVRQEDPFFVTGSSKGIGDDSTFTTPLWNKEIIRVSFRVKNPVQMLGNSSSIYYFNPVQEQWTIPYNSLGDHVGPFEKFSSRYVDNSGAGSLINKGSRFIEDAKGYDSFGFCCSSGSLNIIRRVSQTSVANGNQTSQYVVTNFESARQIELMTLSYPKSIQRSDIYDAEQEVFKLPIDRPFIIEKAVFEIPVAIGKSWFNDKTMMIVTSSVGSDGTLLSGGLNTYQGYTRIQDEGGPGITFSLMCQKNYGRDGAIRDLITRFFVTHDADVQNLTIDNSANGHDNPKSIQYRSHINGLQSVITPDVLIPSTNSKFTGSIVAKVSANITNGFKLYYSQDITSSASPVKATSISECVTKARQFLNSEYIDTVSEEASQTGVRQVNAIDTFGRGMTGFAPSGGSIFGREYGSIDFSRQIKNPFYSYSDAEKEAFLTSLNYKLTNEGRMQSDGGNWTAGVIFNTALFLTSSQESPYLVRPGDSLVLSCAKKRPAIKSAKLNLLNTTQFTPYSGSVSMLSSSYYNDIGSTLGHDVTFNTGTIALTLYGSYVKENKEYRL